MLMFVRGNLLESGCEYLVNPVNCVGVMGKGLALSFKETFPEYFKRYKADCKARKYVPGKLRVDTDEKDVCILSFPTKDVWWKPSQMQWVDSGLADLSSFITTEASRRKVVTLAMPLVGTGNGGLKPQQVLDRIYHCVCGFPTNVKTLVYVNDAAVVLPDQHRILNYTDFGVNFRTDNPLGERS